MRNTEVCNMQDCWQIINFHHVSIVTFSLQAKLRSLKECHKGADGIVDSTTVLL
jgi:hypothetical protein